MTRALLVRPGPTFSVQDVARGWVRGLEANGVRTLDLNLDDRLDFYSQAHVLRGGEMVKAMSNDDAMRLAAKSIEVCAYEWWPDIIVIVSGFFVPLDMYPILRDRGHHVVVVMTESPYEDDKQLDLAALADTVVLNDPTNIERYQAINPNTVYVPHAYDPAVHHPGPPVAALRSDFAFVGTAYQSRIDFFEQVAWPTDDVLLAGNWAELREESPLRRHVHAHDLEECMDNDTTADVYRSAKVSANVYRRESQRPELAAGWAMGPREVELAACETFFLREPRAEGDDTFPMLPTFTEPAEFSELLAWWLDHPTARESAARAAREAITDRTFENHAARLLARIESTPTRIRV